jgi:hypothetical protein
MISNLLINGDMEFDDAHEGAEIDCQNAVGSATEVANRWYVQFAATGAVVKAQRVLWAGAPQAAGAVRISVARPAKEVVELDRVQLFQPVLFDEMFGSALATDLIGKGLAQPLPLSFRFSIKTNIDLQVGCTINNAVVTRNWTTNRAVAANQWTRIEIPIEPDAVAAWAPDASKLSCYFQIGLSCGKTRLSTIDGRWNDGHFLMLENPTMFDFLKTQGAEALITRCYLGVADAGADFREPSALGLLRTQRHQEKSYTPGVVPGTPNASEGALQFKAFDSSAFDLAAFMTTKNRPPRVEVYSPTSGARDCACDITAGKDVPVVVQEVGCSHVIVGVPNSIAGHVYRYHWVAKTFG